MNTDEQQTFHGLKVIDCASFIAAPAAATLFADFGADVIKVEPPEGDPYRELFRPGGLGPDNRNYGWELDSRNKRSLAVDLKRPEGLAILHRLVAHADVFITNLPLSARTRLGIDHETLCALNPRLIYASLTAYGEAGAEADRTGFDITAYWARTGLMDLVRSDHTAVPARSAAGMGDHPSGMTLYAAVTTALYRRERTGKGGLVRTSLMANGVFANSCLVQARLLGAPVPPRPPREQIANALTNLYQCHNGRWLQLGIINETRQWVPLLQALQRPDLADDPRFADLAARRANNEALIRIMDDCFASLDLTEWRKRLDAHGLTYGVVHTLDEVGADPQMHATGALLPFAQASGFTVAAPFQVAGTPQVAPGHAPGLGEHTAQLLREAGFADDQIEQFRARGIVAG